MSDQYQRSLPKSDLEKITSLKYEELQKVSAACFKATQKYHHLFQVSLSWEDAFLLTLLGDYSGYDVSLLNFFRNSRTLSEVSPIWDVSLSTRASDYIRNQNEKYSYIYFILDLIKGRFQMTYESDFYLLINSSLAPSNELCGLVLIETYPEFALKILVSLFKEDEVNNSINQFCSVDRNISKFKNVEFEGRYFQVSQDSLMIHYPGSICGMRDLMRVSSFQGNGGLFGNISGEVEEKNEAPDVIVIPAKQSQDEWVQPGEDYGNPYFKNLHEKRQYLDPGLPFTPLDEVENQFSEDLINFKYNLMKNNREKYLRSVGLGRRDLTTWTNLLVDWHMRDFSGQIGKYDIYENSGLLWRISIGGELLSVLKQIDENEFIHYFTLFIRFGLGFVIQDVEMFYLINEKANDDFIFSIVPLNGTNLKSVLVALYVEFDEKQNFSYKINFSDFCNDQDLLQKIDSIRKESSYVKIFQNFGKQGMKSLVLIQKNQKIIPVMNLNTIKPSSKKKNIHFLYSLMKSQADANILLQDSNKRNHYSTKVKLNNEFQNEAVYLFTFSVEIPEKSEYLIQMSINLEKRNIQYYENLTEKRTIPESPDSFLFNVEFKKHAKDFSKEQPPGKPLKDIFAQFFYYLSFIRQNSREDLFEYLVNSFVSVCVKLKENFSKDFQFYVLQEVDREFEVISNDNLERFYCLLCILSVTEAYPIEMNLNDNSLKKLIEIITSSNGKYLIVLRPKTHFDSAVKGIVKSFFVLKNKGLDFRYLFDNFYDYNYLRVALKTYLELHKERNLKVDQNDFDCILTYSQLFTHKQTEMLLKYIIEMIKEPLRLLALFSHNCFLNKPLSEKQKALNESIKSFRPNISDLIEFLRTVKEKYSFNHLIDIREVSKMIEEVLMNKESITRQNLSKIKEIFEFVISENNVFQIDIKLKANNLMNFFTFSECLPVFSLIPNDIPELFQSWMSRSAFSITNKQALQQIEKEFESIPKKFQDTLAPLVLTKIDHTKLFEMIENMDSLRSISLKNAYKSSFRDHFFHKSVYESTISKLFSSRNKKKLKNCTIYKEICIEAQSLICPSEEEMIQRILKSPNENDLLFSFIRDKEAVEDSEVVQKVQLFIKNFCEEIETNSMPVTKFALLENHSEIERSVFYEYLQTTIDNSGKYEVFLDFFTETEKKYKETTNFLRFMKKFVLIFVFDFPELAPVIDVYQEIEAKYEYSTISDLNLPIELDNLSNLLSSYQLPYKSMFYSRFMKLIAAGYQGNFESCMIETLQHCNNFIVTMLDINSNKTTTVEHIHSWFLYIENFARLSKEMILFRKYFPQYLEDQLFTLEKKITEVYSKVNNFYSLKPLIKSISLSFKLLGFSSNPLGKYSILDEMNYSGEAANLLSSLLKEEISNLSLKVIENANIFIQTAEENANLVILAGTLEEDDLSYWRESFISNMDNNGLTLEILEKFISISSFLNKLKNYLKKFKGFCERIASLMTSPQHLTIIEDLGECGKNFNSLDNYNKSLNNQEQIKLNKIKMISNDSKIIIKKCVDGFQVELLTVRLDQGYTLKGLDLRELKELRDRALLSKYIIDNKKENQAENQKQDLEIYNNFVEFVNSLCRFIETLNKLNNTLFRDTLFTSHEYFIKNQDYRVLNLEALQYLTLFTDHWKKYFKAISKISYIANYLNGENIYKIDQFVFCRSQVNLNAITSLLKYMQRAPPQATGQRFKVPESMMQRLNIIEDFLEGLSYEYLIPKFPLEKVIQLPQIPGSILIVETKEFYVGVLTVYSLYRKIVPRGDLVFFCHFFTGWDEIKLFLNRCFLNGNQEIYTLVNPENLSFDSQVKLESKIHRQFSLKNYSFYLAIVTNDPGCKLVSNLNTQYFIPVEKIQQYQILEDSEIKKFVSSLSQRIVVVKSSYAGLGKSTYISKECGKKRCKIYEYNISATFSIEDLYESIEKFIHINDIIFKFNLNYLSEPQFFNELIFSLALFSCSGSGKSMISLPQNSMIYIEVANTFNDHLFKSVSFLKFLKIIEITSFTLENLKFTKEINYVCKYLQALTDSSINKVDLKHSKIEKIDKTLKKTFLSILKKFFMPICGENPNFHQLNTFVRVLSKMFQNFEKSMFSAEIMTSQHLEYQHYGIDIFKNLRSCIMENLIETAKEFTSRCFDSVRKGQNSMISRIENENAEEIVVIDCSIKWENSNHFIMVFMQEGDFMNIYRSAEKVPINIKKFIISQKIIEDLISGKTQNFKERWANCLKGVGEIEDFNKYSSQELMEKLLGFYSRYSLRSDNEGSLDVRQLKQTRLIDLVSTGYILTPDNFLKMNLIFIRCISNIPLIIMGETGCGKTSLLRFFVENILQEKLMIIYIHSGVTSKDITKLLLDANVEAEKTSKERVWVFFDEFNTSEMIGEIVSILCEKRSKVKINPKVVFIGACNPFRVKKSVKFKENVGIQKKNGLESKVQLVHIVKPLPDKAIEFVWDFGVLRAEEIRNYVKNMLAKVEMKKIEMFVDLVCTAHEYFQNSEDVSSVSLRDVNRFTLLYEWFRDSLEARRCLKIEKPLNEYHHYLDYFNKLKSKEVYPGLLAFFHSYFLRISDLNDRIQFMEIIITHAKMFDSTLSIEMLESLIRLEQLEMMSRMNLPEEIALNQALMENIFAIIPCILNKIPIFICGKPGCSKSLAIQIISSSMRGEKSSDPYFLTLPELHIVSFQGSDSCTSEGIEEVFSVAEKIQLQKKDVFPVVLFDEIGLAEVSKYNPLKILHKLLEYENCKVGFIAISNWRLDASKMNRALYLARPDPDEKDLIETAKTLFQSFRKMDDSKQYLGIVEKIAKGYFAFKEFMKQLDFPDFYGLRDFYHTLKMISKKIHDNYKDDLHLILQEAILRNFNGLEGAAEILPEFFKEAFSGLRLKTTSTMLMIKNLEEQKSRYLMIICAQDVSEYLKSAIIEYYFDDFRFLIGSTFENDVNHESSRFRILSDIIGYMEQGVPIVLQNMDIIYTSLYDLFNQNFTVLGKTRKYCRVALGAHFNPRCFVHDKFKAVVFLDNDKDVIQATDAPFLNRFEKHYILLKDLIETQYLEISNQITEWVKEILKIKGKANRLKPVSIFPCYSEETINLMIQMMQDEDSGIIIEKCQRFLLKNSSCDVVFLAKVNSMDPTLMRGIVQQWNHYHSLNFTTYLSKLCNSPRYLSKGKRVRLICTTFESQSIDSLREELSQFVQFEKCCNFRSEEELKMSYDKFLSDPQKVLYLFELDYQKEGKHFRFVVSFLETIDKNTNFENKQIVKNVCLLVRIQRNDLERKAILLFKGWRYRMFDDLWMHPEQLEMMMNYDLVSIIKSKNFYDFSGKYEEITQKAFDTIYFQSPLHSFEQLQQVKKSLIEYFCKERSFSQLIEAKIIETLNQAEQGSKVTWIMQLFTSENVINSARSIKNALDIHISERFLLEYTKLLIACEKKSGLGSVLKTKSHETILNIWKDVFRRLQTKNVQVHLKASSNHLNYLTELWLPFIYEDYKALKAKFQELVKTGEEEKVASELKLFHLQKTLWQGKGNLFYDNPIISSYFILDFIEISLIERNVEKRHTTHIFKIIERILSGSDERIKELFKQQQIIFNLNEIISIFTEYSTSQNLDWIFNSFSEIPELKDQEIKAMFEKIIEDISPLGEKFSEKKDLGEYSESIRKVRDHLASFPKPENFGKLEFWSEICRLGDKTLVLDIACDLLGESHEFLFSNQMADKIIRSLVNRRDLPTSAAYKFKIFYYNQLLQFNPLMIPSIADEIRVKDAWKVSGPLIETLLKSSELKEKLEDFECEDLEMEGFLKVFESENLHLRVLGDFLSSCQLNDPFCILFSDKLKLLDFKVTSRRQGVKNFKVYLDAFERFSQDNDQLKALVASARVKFYLNQFVVALNPSRKDLKVNEEATIQDFGKVLIGRKNLVYELYCLKLLKSVAGVSTLKLNELCSQTKYKWNINYKDIGVKSTFDVFPFLEEFSLEYKACVIKICALVDNIKELDEIISKPKTDSELFTLGLAFLNSVYLMYTRPNFSKTPYLSWFSQNEASLSQRYGQTYSNLLKLFIQNFPKSSTFHLTGNSSNRDLHLSMVVSYVMLIGVCFTSPNQFSSQFFDTSRKLHNNFKVTCSNFYFIGAERLKIHDYLSYIRVNFEQIKNTTYKNYYRAYSKGGSHVCSNTCDYLYIINDCGGAMVESKCPFCGNIIGGRNHQIIQREGHRNLSDEEAIQFLNTKITHYQSIEPRGFTHNSTNLPLTSPHKLRSQISFILLNIFTNSMFDFLSLSGICTDADLKAIYKSHQELPQVLIERILSQDFADLQEKIKSEELIYWIFSAVNKFRKLMISMPGEPSRRSDRDEFEKVFEDQVIDENFIDLCNAYKKSLRSQTVPSVLIGYIEELELPKESLYNMTDLFRFTTVPTWDSLTEAFSLINKKEEFSILSFYISNFGELSNLKHFFKIITFAREMIDECSFTMSRAEANTMKMREFLSTRQEFNIRFKEFREAWGKLRLVLRYDCKIFDKIEISQDTPIGYFLVDTDINSLGIRLAACLRNLAEIQNGILGLVDSGVEHKKYPILKIDSEDVFFIQSEDLMTIIQSCSNHCLDYGKGQEIVYDWERVTLSIKQFLEKAKMLDCENLQTVQFQFELLHARSRYAGIISEIRERVPQVNLTEDDRKIIERKVRAKVEEHNVSITEIWKQAHTWLEKLLLKVRHARSKEKEVILNVSDFSLKVEIDFRVWEIFGDFKIEKTLNIFEVVEVEVFEEIVKMIDEQYKIQFGSEENLLAANFFGNCMEVKRVVIGFCSSVLEGFGKNNEIYAKGVLKEVGFVMKRIILRLLTANTDPKFKVVDYFGIEDYWNCLFLNDLETVTSLFPQDICLEHAIYFEKELSARIAKVCI